MDPRHLFIDERHTNMCVYCGAQPDTRDHVPAKVLLDKPYPPQLPVVGACKECNEGFSMNEQYLSCFLECVICGTVEAPNLRRPNVKRILRKSFTLKRRIEACQQNDKSGNLLWQPESKRVQKIVEKLARGHVAYELYPKLEKPMEVNFTPLSALAKQERAAFENVTSVKLDLWPEIGSRAFLRGFRKNPDQFDQGDGWIVVQPGRYRYIVIETGGILVRIVLSEYLACEVSWE